MNEYLAPLTNACLLVTLNYIALKIRGKMIIEPYEGLLAPLLTGIASMLMMLEPLPEALGLIDLRSLPIFMAGLQYGLPGALLSTLVPAGFGLFRQDDNGISVIVQELVIPALLSAFFHNKEYRRGFLDIPVRHGVQISLLVFVARLLIHVFSEPVLSWDYAANQIFMLLIASAAFIVLIVMFNDENTSWRLQRQLEIQANQDGLTRLPNLRSFTAIAENVMKKRKISIFMIDIDNFKHFNDQFGHLEGDQLLRDIGALLRNSIQEQDYAARYGGEEFILLSTETDPDRVVRYADRLCRTVAHHFRESRPDSTMPITVSIGISTARSVQDELQRIVSEADQALYASKHSGKNRVTLFDGPTDLTSQTGHEAKMNAY